VPVLPFYGAANPRLFAIERAAMDPAGRVLAAIDGALRRDGLVLDVGAGDGFTALRLDRDVVAMEPAEGMRRPGNGLRWVGGDAEHLPFADDAFSAAYSTWAYFFTGPGWDPSPGVAELHRVVRRGGPLVIVDNLGGDEFTAPMPQPAGADVDQWASLGFACTMIDTTFELASVEDARELLTLYFADAAPADPPLVMTYRVGVFTSAAR
jgi:SAM-dependent methyltransferase